MREQAALRGGPTFGLSPEGRARLQHGALYVVLASVAVSAAIGVFALLVGEFGQTQGKLLGSSLSVTGASAIALVCGFAWGRGRLGPVPPAGIAFGIAGFGLLIIALWTSPDDEAWPRTIMTLLTLAGAATHASIVSPFGLARRWRWVFGAAYGLNVAVSALIVFGVWAEPDNEVYARSLGAVAVLLTAVTIAIPVLRRLSPPEQAVVLELRAEHCPRCGAALPEPGAGHCPACDSRFDVHFLD